MFASIFIKYILPLLIVATISSYFTHKITVNSYKAEQHDIEIKQIADKKENDQELNRISNKQEAERVQQDSIKEINRKNLDKQTQTTIIYRDVKCSLTDETVSELDAVADRINNTRK